MQTALQQNCRLCIKLNTARLERLYKNEKQEKQEKKRRLMKQREAFVKKCLKR